MAGSIKGAPEQLLQLLMIVFLHGMITPQRHPTCCGDQYALSCDRAVFFCTTLAAAAFALWFAQRAADRGGRLLLRGLLLLGACLSAASCFLLVDPVVGNAIAVHRLYMLGFEGLVALAGAATGAVFVAGAAVIYIVFALEALLTRELD